MFAKVFAVLSVLSFALGAPVEAEQLETRITHTGRATYFSTGLGACGWWSNDSDMIVALNQDMYEQNNGGNCGQWMSITNENTGNTVEAYVADECPSPGCGSGDLDMSPSLFAALNNGNMDDGVFPISWNFHPKN